MSHTPQATLTAPGLCHNLDLTGSPHAGMVTERADGALQVPLCFGTDLAAHDIVENVTDPEYLICLVDAALCALSRLKMALQDRPEMAA